MPPTDKASHSPAKPNVHRLFKVEPREGWTLDGPFGHMAFEAGDDGRLERLAEVVKWLQSSKKIPRGEAVKLLFDAMQPEVMEWLYWLKSTEFATPVPLTATLGYLTAQQLEARKSSDRQDALQRGLDRERSYGRFGTPVLMQGGRISFGYPEPTEPGLPALLKYLRGWWALPKRKRDSTCDMLDDITVPKATMLAIRLDKAHELWGYGRPAIETQTVDVTSAEPTTWAELVRFRRRHTGSVWSVAQKRLIAQEKLRREATPGAQGIAKAMAKELGISVTLLNGHIRAANEPGKRAGRNINTA